MMLNNLFFLLCKLSNFDVVIQLLTCSYFALSGLSFFEKKFQSKDSEFQKIYKEIDIYLKANNDYKASKDAIHHRNILSFKCYCNSILYLYPNRFNEIFYKGGILGVVVLIFLAFSKSDEELNLCRIFPVFIYCSFSTLILSRRLFNKINKDKILSVMVQNENKMNIDNIIYPFENINNINSESKHKIQSFFKKCNPKYMKPITGRSVFKRSILHLFIIIFLLHLNWFGISYNYLIELINSLVNFIFNDSSFLKAFLIFRNNNLEKYFQIFMFLVLLMPYIITIVFYAINLNINKNFECEAKVALENLTKLQDKDQGVNNKLIENLTKTINKIQHEESLLKSQ